MRFLHTADLHLDSAFCKVGTLDADAQRKKQRELLERIFSLAQSQSCDMILIAGDLFDTPAAMPESAALALRLFDEWKKPVFIAPGNHDALVAGGFYKSAALPDNVYLFTSEELQYFDIEELGVTVAGYAFTAQSLPRSPLSPAARPREESLRTLLLCAHTEIDTPTSRYAPITTAEIARHGFDYAALGHVHNPPVISERVRYCGFPEGRAFDEQGDGGVLIVDIDDYGNVEVVRKITSTQKFIRSYVSLDPSFDLEQIKNAIRAEVRKHSLDTHLRIYLTGIISADTRIDGAAICDELEASLASLEIIDDTAALPDAAALQKDPTLRGEFYRTLLPSLLSDDEQTRGKALLALRIGLAAIDGRSFSEGGSI